VSARAFATAFWLLVLSALAFNWLPFVLIPLEPTAAELERGRSRARERRRARILS